MADMVEEATISDAGEIRSGEWRAEEGAPSHRSLDNDHYHPRRTADVIPTRLPGSSLIILTTASAFLVQHKAGNWALPL
jgi:hypothetical protein